MPDPEAPLERDGAAEPDQETQVGLDGLGITQGTASTLAEALVAAGLVERQAVPEDGRASRLVITETGRSRAEAWMADYATVAEELFGVLTPAQQAELRAVLRVLTADVSDGETATRNN